MTNIFYFLVLFLLLHEMVWVAQTGYRVDKSEKLKAATKMYRSGQTKELSKEDTVECSLNLGAFIIMLIGLISSQWVAFLVYMLFMFIVSFVAKAFSRNGKVVIHFFASIIGVALLAFIIVNKYHLHINLYDFIKQHI